MNPSRQAETHQPAFVLYPRNSSTILDAEVFRNPSSEYRGAPFWCWNNRLDRKALLGQIEQLRTMGMGGATLHVRTGLDTEYLGRDFFSLVAASAEKAKKQKMLIWLYDEDRWPSGFAGGLVTHDVRFRARHLLWTPRPYGIGATSGEAHAMAGGSRTENGSLLSAYEVETDARGFLKHHRRLAAGDSTPRAGAKIWYAYLETSQPSSWFNNQTYVDTLNPRAVERFVEVTHERYRAVVGQHFGKSIPAIFTDEPQFVHKQCFRRGSDISDLIIPWTDGFGEDLLDALPEIFWDLPDGRASVVRYRYHDRLAELFASAFADTVGGWCRKNGIALTGHMMEEPSLHSQTQALGEAMRSYRSFDLPGIDMLCDWREYTTAKQAQTAAHQFGAPGVLSELYGVTNWDFDFAGHKAQGDWQAALGITVRVPHLAWAGMEGEAKRDYPASIFYQSPWFAEYHLVEDHFARVNTVLTRGKPGVRIGVIHPIESFWLSWGPVEANALVREDQETAFASLADWLLHGLIDFDYICESLLPSQCPLPKAKMSEFRVGKMKYDAIVVPPMRTIRSSTLDRLEKFSGAIIFAGDVPMLVDAVPDDRAQRLAARSTRIAFRRAQVLQALDPFRDVEVFGSQSLLHQLRLDGKNRQLFFCNTDVLKSQDCTIRVRGHWGVMERNTLTGQSRPLNADCSGGWTRWQHHFDAHGHLLLTLEPGAPNKNDPSNRADSPPMVECGRLKGPVPVTLSEPNVLLLDLAEWCLDRGPWQAEEEILRVDNLVRSRLGLPPRTGNVAQPWTDKEPMPDLAEVGLRYRLFCESPVDKPSLALEQPDGIRILLDGKPVASKVSGHWVDPAIKTLRLPSLSRGHHSLEIFRPFHRRSGLEAAYLLGDFGVQLAGREVKIVAPVRHLAFGDFTRQGLPFYTGNVTYHCTVNGNNHPAELAFAWPRAFRLQVLSQNERQQSGILPRTRIPLIKVKLDGKDRGAVAFAPFRLRLGRLKPGKHPLDITCFGNRFNVFGSLHNLNQEHLWAETCPDAWRTNGADWTYEYQIRPMGILNSPAILAPQW